MDRQLSLTPMTLTHETSELKQISLPSCSFNLGRVDLDAAL